MPTAITQPAPGTVPADHAVRCLEVWGGTEAVQTTLTLPGVDAYVFSEPFNGDKLGGDIHYVSSCFTGRVARFAVADVAGHGHTVADLAKLLRNLMRKHINYLDQTRLARVLNKEFADLDSGGRFATAILISYFAPTDHLIICNAGHPRPLWYRAAEKSWLFLDHQSPLRSDAPNNLPLGIIDPTSYIQFAVKLSPDDLVLLYTDSLTESKAPDGAQLNEPGLLKLAQSIPLGPPEKFSRNLLDAVARHRGNAPADDDVTLITLHHNAGNPPSHPIRDRIRYVADLLGLAGD